MPATSSRMVMPSLPAGFRFHPTDEELIVHYLMNQAANTPCPVPIIAEVNIYQCNPWDLPRKALFGEKEWYFFSPRDRKYPNGARPNRAAGSGYWKATGTDKAIPPSSSSPTSGESVGVKKALVFYRGKPPRGVKTDWVMHEYRLTAVANNNNKTARRRGPSSSSSSMRLDDWVLCRIYKKSNNFQFSSSDQQQEQEEGSTVVEEEEEDTSLHNINSSSGNTTMNINNGGGPSPNYSDGDHQFQFPPLSMSMMTKSCSLTDLLSTIDYYSTLSQLLLDDAAPAAETTTDATPQQSHTLNNLNNNNNGMNVPQHAAGDALFCSESDHYGAAGYSYNSDLKRKRIMTTDSAATADHTSSLDDDDGGRLKKKLLQQLPSESRSGSSSSSGLLSSYCNQQQLAEADAQYSGLPSHHPFLTNQQLLLLVPNNHHLEMQ